VLEAIKTELRRFGAGISRVEMVGLVPRGALLESALHYLQVMDFSPDELVEQRLDEIMRARL
jgi:glutamate formiminotransferase